MKSFGMWNDLVMFVDTHVPGMHGDNERLLQISSTIFCAVLVGLSGILPLIFIPLESGKYLHSNEGKRKLNYWLSFALGSMLGDVFFHLLPEAWSNAQKLSGKSAEHSHEITKSIGMWTISGLLLFFIIEKIFIQTQDDELSESKKQTSANNNSETHDETKNIQVEGYLNLMANIIDNFTHGMAVGASFLVSNQLGFMTTICILVHEIPHEISDFVMLLRAGFDRFGAARAQFLTALGSVVGALFALTADSITTGHSKAWILPFTSGGFLYIALVSVTPSLLKETNSRQSAYHVLLVMAGLLSMVLMSLYTDS